MTSYHILTKRAIEVRPLTTGGSAFTGGSVGALGGGALGAVGGLGKTLLDDEKDSIGSALRKILTGGAIGAVGGAAVGGVAGNHQKNEIIDEAGDQTDRQIDTALVGVPSWLVGDRQVAAFKNELRNTLETTAPDVKSNWRDAVKTLFAGRGGVQKDFHNAMEQQRRNTPTPLASMDKSAARGDQLLKSLRALAIRAQHGTPQSSAGAATRLDRATGYGLQRGADGADGLSRVKGLIQQKPLLGGDREIMALTGKKGPFRPEYAKEYLNDVDPAWVSQPGEGRVRGFAEQILAAMGKAGK